MIRYKKEGYSKRYMRQRIKVRDEFHENKRKNLNKKIWLLASENLQFCSSLETEETDDFVPVSTISKYWYKLFIESQEQRS